MSHKFIADSMLGKLARWLRLMGFDTLYYPSIPDEDLVKKAKEEKRIILTKDSELVRKNKESNFIYITSSDPYQQIKMVVKSLKLNPWKRLFSRCVYCNKLVEKIDNISKFREKIPSYAYRTCFSFYRCPECGKIYWEGSHHSKIKAKIKAFLEEEDEV